MKRREVVVGLAGTAAWPFPLRAQPSPPSAKIGYLAASSPEASARVLQAFRRRLHELGRFEGQSITIDYRFAENDYGRLPQLATELVRSNVDLLVAAPTPTVAAARNATKTIPIVMIAAIDPVRLGWVANLAHPSENLTGISFGVGVETFAKELELLKQISPQRRRVAVLSNTAAYPSHKFVLETMQTTATSSGIQLLPLEIQPNDLRDAFIAIEKHGADALVVNTEVGALSEARRLADFALEHRLPTISHIRAPVEAGGPMSYGPNVSDLWARAAEYVDKILRGAKPGDLPVEQPTRFQLLLNLRTARALGIAIPLSVQAQADEVIE
jgi:putative ABC transport system substrate-binding protein